MRRPTAYTVTAYMVVDRDGTEVQLTLKGHYTEDAPGRSYGPPEDCYEDEPATVDILSVRDENGRRVELTVDEEELAVERLLDVGADEGTDVEANDYWDDPDMDDDDDLLDF